MLVGSFLEGSGWSAEQDHLLPAVLQWDLISACLAALPAGITALELGPATQVPASLLALLARFQVLQELAITGDGSWIDWLSSSSRTAAPAVASKLTHLTLRFYRRPEELRDLQWKALKVTDGMAQLLAASASSLQVLDVEALWSEALGQLCRSLPALRSLRYNTHTHGRTHARS